ncbi:hypothetical protein [Nocardia donostiensis]|uniref:Uncharacterized protein n=1 Tax=Nocardia donostiensis TaxID=1538463 RepID=A0A1V2TG80_9NOCA|nr:hypothetical protein [Nocardia donostiensis]ONM48516.1 hypothetical protein B0T46_12560 [Nocardia donostiensis]OQS19006.1 hypothetical protein B0T44_16750 [Nocardia donostiensis]
MRTNGPGEGPPQRYRGRLTTKQPHTRNKAAPPLGIRPENTIHPPPNTSRNHQQHEGPPKDNPA